MSLSSKGKVFRVQLGGNINTHGFMVDAALSAGDAVAQARALYCASNVACAAFELANYTNVALILQLVIDPMQFSLEIQSVQDSHSMLRVVPHKPHATFAIQCRQWIAGEERMLAHGEHALFIVLVENHNAPLERLLVPVAALPFTCPSALYAAQDVPLPLVALENIVGWSKQYTPMLHTKLQLPLFDAPSSELPQNLERLVCQTLSFTLRWHRASLAKLPGQRSEDATHKWRTAQLWIELHNRSLRYFGKLSAFDVLFAQPGALLFAGTACSALLGKEGKAVQFVATNLCSALRFVLRYKLHDGVRDETMQPANDLTGATRDLLLLKLFREALPVIDALAGGVGQAIDEAIVKTAARLETGYADLTGASPTPVDIESDDEDSLDTIIRKDAARAVPIEPVAWQMRWMRDATHGLAINDRIRFDTFHSDETDRLRVFVDTPTELCARQSIVEYLVGEQTDRCCEALEARHGAPVLIRQGAFDGSVMHDFVLDTPSALAQQTAVCVGGIVYRDIHDALGIIERLFEWTFGCARDSQQLCESLQPVEGDAISNILECFCASLPQMGNSPSYRLASCGRNRRLDDVAVRSAVYTTIFRSLSRTEVMSFMRHTIDHVALPKDLDVATIQRVTVSDEEIAMHRSNMRTGGAGLVPRGKGVPDYRVHQLALLTVTHTDRCFFNLDGTDQRPTRSFFARVTEPSATSETSEEARRSRRAHLTVGFSEDQRDLLAIDVERQIDAQGLPDELEAVPDALRRSTASCEKPACEHSCVDTTLTGIEDLVGNLAHTRALPLCIASQVNRLLDGSPEDSSSTTIAAASEASRKWHPKNEDRKDSFRHIMALGLPYVDVNAATRHLMRQTPNEKVGDHLKEYTGGLPRMLGSMHTHAATGYAKRMIESGESITQQEALMRTNCAPSCSTLISAGGGGGGDRKNSRFAKKRKSFKASRKRDHVCPFTWSNRSDLRRLLQHTGTQPERIEFIVSSDAHETRRCAMHLESSRAPAHRSIPMFSGERHGARIRRPAHFTYLAADHLLQAREDLRKKATN